MYDFISDDACVFDLHNNMPIYNYNTSFKGMSLKLRLAACCSLFIPLPLKLLAFFEVCDLVSSFVQIKKCELNRWEDDNKN